MKKIGKLFLVLTFSGTLLVTGCAPTKANPQLDALQGQISHLQKENENLVKQVSELQKQIDDLHNKEQLQDDNIVEEEIIDDSNVTTDTAFYPVYGVDMDTLEKEVLATEEVDASSTLLAKLNRLAWSLSEVNFDGLPILVEEISEVGGKQIAIINLKEDSSKDIGWMTVFFQGSTGALMTANSLQETFLQRELMSGEEWIDGIQILYEGQSKELDHMPEIGKIIYR